MKVLFRSGLVVAALLAPAVASTAASAKGRITVHRVSHKAPPMMPGYYTYGYGSYNPPFYSYAILAPLFKPLF